MCSAVAPTSDTEPTSRGAAVLCVDDSENILTICRAILEAGGYQVLTAAGGKEALEALQQHPIDIVVIDNRMPGMSGAELAQEIRRNRQNIPILMFSDSDGEPAASGTIDLFLNKKSGPRALRNAVRSLLSKSNRPA